jgi:hypothetical protein
VTFCGAQPNYIECSVFNSGTVIAKVKWRMKFLVLLLIVLFGSISTRQGLADDQGPKPTRLKMLFNYKDTVSHQTSTKTFNRWFDLESSFSKPMTLRNKPFQVFALQLLDNQTNQLSGRTDGFEWASNARMKYLSLIGKIQFPYQLDYFRGALKIGLLGFAKAYSLRNNLEEHGLLEGNDLSESDYSKLRVVRHVISHFDEILEENVQSELASNRIKLESIDRAELGEQQLSQSFSGRCALKFSQLKILALGFIH